MSENSEIMSGSNCSSLNNKDISDSALLSEGLCGETSGVLHFHGFSPCSQKESRLSARSWSMMTQCMIPCVGNDVCWDPEWGRQAGEEMDEGLFACLFFARLEKYFKGKVKKAGKLADYGRGFLKNSRERQKPFPLLYLYFLYWGGAYPVALRDYS